MSSLRGAEITGKVRDAGADNVTVVIDGEALPAVGDSAEIFFKIPGADEEIAVASGTVAAVEAKVVKIKIEKATGTIEKDQLARIKSGRTPPTPATSPSPSTPAPTSPSIIGDWIGNLAGGGTLSLSFKADGTLLWVSEGAQYAMSTLAKYRIDPSTKLQGIELFDFEEGDMKGATLHGLFELQSDGLLKLDFVEKQLEPLKEFSKNALVFSKAASPIARPPQKTPAQPTPAQTPAPTASPAVAATPTEAARYFAEGIAKYEAHDLKGALAVFTKAIGLDPTKAAFFANRAAIYNLLKQPERGLADANEAIRLSPQLAIAYTIRANCYSGTNQFKRALEDYDEAIRLDPKNADAYNDRGLFHWKLGKNMLAIEDFTRAIELNSADVDVLTNRARLYQAMGQTKLAKLDFARVKELKAQAKNKEKSP